MSDSAPVGQIWKLLLVMHWLGLTCSDSVGMRSVLHKTSPHANVFGQDCRGKSVQQMHSVLFLFDWQKLFQVFNDSLTLDSIQHWKYFSVKYAHSLTIAKLLCALFQDSCVKLCDPWNDQRSLSFGISVRLNHLPKWNIYQHNIAHTDVEVE